MNLFVEGNDRCLPRGMNWINEPAQWAFDEQGELVITAPPLADFFIDPNGTSVRHSAPFCYTEIEGDFTVSTQVEVDMRDEADSACLLVMAEDTQWAKICFEYAYKKPTIVSVVTRGVSDDCNSQIVEISRPFLRATRFGNCYAFHYSLDGVYWYLVRYFKMESPLTVKVGVVAQAPVGQGGRSQFGFLHYSPTPVEHLRSGE